MNASILTTLGGFPTVVVAIFHAQVAGASILPADMRPLPIGPSRCPSSASMSTSLRSGSCCTPSGPSGAPGKRSQPAGPSADLPPPQIIGRPDDVERLLDEAGQRVQEVERGAAQAIEETAAVAAEEGEVAVAAEGVGGAFGGPGRRSSGPRTHGGRGCWSDGCHGGSWRSGDGDSQAAQPTAWPAARGGCWRTRSSGLSRAARTRPCRTSGPPTTWEFFFSSLSRGSPRRIFPTPAR